MAQDTQSDSPQRNSNDAPPQSEKRVISSVITHKKLLDEIKLRNPIIAGRDLPKG
jgi:hypothetical protein